MTLLPKRLKKGDTIGIIAPSNPIWDSQKERMKNAEEKFALLGLKVVYSKHCFATDKFGASAGSAEDRVSDLHAMFEDDTISAVYCAQGGDTANAMLPLIDFDLIQRHPKLFLGMSDVDVLHLAIHSKTDLVSVTCCDPKCGGCFDLDFSYSWESFQKRLLFGSKEILPLSDRKCVRGGTASGKLIGCNFSSMLKLAGTPYFPDFTNAILFLEGYRETPKTALFKLQQLKQIGVFDKIKGLVIGYVYGFENEVMKKENNILHTYEDIVLDVLKDYDFPILKTQDFGHYCPHAFLPIGATVAIDADLKMIEIVDDFLE